MPDDQNEDLQLRSVALQNAKSILAARERAEGELTTAKAALESKTEELAVSLAMVQATLEAASDAILVTDAEGKVTNYNQKYAEMWRLSPEVMAMGEHKKIAEVCSKHVHDPWQYLVRVNEIYDVSPPESFDQLKLIDGRVIERVSTIQYIGAQNVGRVWSFRDITERTRAEEEVRQQREWFQVTLRSIGDAVITTDIQGRVTFLNPIAERLTGWSSEEASGQPLKTVFNIINEETREPAFHPIDKVLREGVIVGLSNHTALIAKNGTETSIEDSAAPIRDSAGRLSGAVMVFHDVTGKRRDEEALRENEQKLRAIFEQAAVGIVMTDLKGQFEEVNQRFSEILGYTQEELLKLTFQALTFPEDLPSTEENMQRLLAGQIADYVIEKRYIRKDGTLVWGLATVTLLKDASGQPQQLLGIIEDITSRKKAEEASSRLSAVVECSDDAIISKTLNGIITSWNKSAERIFGYEAHEVIGQPIYILFPPDRLDEEREILTRLRRGERIDHYETERIRKDGTRLNVSLTVSAIKDNNGRIIGASKIARDITERKRAENALQEAQIKLSLHAEELEKQVVQRTAHLNQSIQSLESLCYTIAHDLRAPLRAVQGFTQVILEEYAPAFDDEGKALATRVVTAATRMDALIRDLLEYAKLSHVDLPCNTLDLNTVLQKVIENLSQEIISKSAQISVQSLPQVWGNPTIVDQIFTNILSNALKFVNKDIVPVIEIRAESMEHGPRVFIKDNGIGIAVEHHARIFEMFQRLHENEKQFSGTGVGLAIVKKGIERIGGRVSLDARVTSGSCFYLDFQPAKNL
jgi:PAS domain S-box-containing protein